MFFLGQVMFWSINWIPSWTVGLMLFLILCSWLVRKDTLKSLGLRHKGFFECLLCFRFLLIPLLLFILGAGLVKEISLGAKILAKVLASPGYFLFVILQQLFFFSYFANRLHTVTDKKRAQFFTAIIFSSFHIPNIPLLLITFAGGYFMSGFFFAFRNLWALALIHFFISCMVSVALFPFLGEAFPLEHFWSMRVGWGYIKPFLAN